MYVSNLVTQPGKTDGYRVSDHIKVLNKHLRNRKSDVVANNGHIDLQVVEKYLVTENKTMVDLDRNSVIVQGIKIIEDDIFCIEEGRIWYKALNTAFRIFTLLMAEEPMQG